MANDPPVMIPLKLVSHNAQGLNSPAKRRKVFQYLYAQKLDVVLLQETHFSKCFNTSFIHSKFPSFSLANVDDKTKGVGIFFSKRCKFTLESELKDPESRYILLVGELDDKLYSFKSYYAPNKGQLAFFQHLLKTLMPFLEGTMIFGGDSNTAFDQGLDKSRSPGNRLTRPIKQSLRIAKLTFQHGLVDIWREVNPTLRDFTLFSNPHKSLARIDHILITPASIPLTKRAYIKDVVWSDHSMVVLAPQATNPVGAGDLKSPF